MNSLHLESITDQVRRLLQREIEAGRLVPGTRIREEEFAGRLGISKSPLRVALHQLKQDGIIRIEPRKGFYVALPTDRQVLELLEMREVLEGLAARLATVRADAPLIESLEDCFSGFKQRELDSRRLEFSAADLKFQRLFVEASGSSELIKALEAVNLRLHMSRVYQNLSGHHDLVPYHLEHMAIIDAIRNGDPVKAEALVKSHVRRVRNLFIIKTQEFETESAIELPSITNKLGGENTYA